MAAGLGFKDFVTGEVLTAADVDGYLMQGVWVFASAAARDAAVTSPQEGNFAYLKDTNQTTYYTGSAWANLDTTGMTNPMTTTGDTIYSSSGSTPARLGIGSTGQVLTVSGGIPSWATPAGGGGMTLLSTTSASGASFTISSISQSYKNLYILGTNLSATGNAELNFRINGDTGSNYMFASPLSQNATVTGSFSNSATEGDAGAIGTSTAYNVAAFFEMTIPRYTETELKKIHVRAGYATSSTQYALSGTSWDNTAAITSLTFFQSGTFSSGTVYIYGVN